MIENTIRPINYRTWVGFAHDFCKGCVYENGASSSISNDKKIEKCLSCKDDLDDYYYNNREQLLIITKNGEGRNIALAVE